MTCPDAGSENRRGGARGAPCRVTRVTSVARVTRVVGFTLTLALCTAGDTWAQEPTPPPAPPDVPARAVIVVDSATHLVGGAIRVLSGSAQDPEGQEGAADVLGLALERVLAGALAGTATSASVTVERGALTVSFLADPTEWAHATSLILENVFTPPPLVVLEQARADHLQRLRFEAGAPVRDFSERRFAILFGPTSDWARPARGTVDSVLRIDLGTLASRLNRADRGSSAFAALVGPIDLSEAVRLLARFEGAGTPAPSPGSRPLRSGSGLAWTEGDMYRVPVEITSTWVTVAFPAPSDLARDRLALLAHHVREYLSPVPVRPGLLDPRVELLDAPGGPVLFVTFAVAPDAAERWALRVIEVVRLQRDAPPDERFFAWERRRFRAAWRREYSAPDARALAALREPSYGAPTTGETRIEQLRVADLEAVAAVLGPPRTLLYGPDLAGR